MLVDILFFISSDCTRKTGDTISKSILYSPPLSSRFYLECNSKVSVSSFLFLLLLFKSVLQISWCDSCKQWKFLLWDSYKFCKFLRSQREFRLFLFSDKERLRSRGWVPHEAIKCLGRHFEKWLCGQPGSLASARSADTFEKGKWASKESDDGRVEKVNLHFFARLPFPSWGDIRFHEQSS